MAKQVPCCFFLQFLTSSKSFQEEHKSKRVLLNIQISAMDLQVQPGDKRSGQNRVKVAIRVRPFISREISSFERNCFEFPSPQEIVIGNERCYKFDRVFNQVSTQQQVYQDCVRDLMLGCFEGYNAAVLAYGQTGSGKSYTMGTHVSSIGSHEQGILPRVIADIFHEVEARQSQAEFTVRASFIEIYNEQIIDLLQAHKPLKIKDHAAISIREEKDGSVSISGVTEELVGDASQMLALLDRGSLNRTTAATLMNDASSRSHAIFTVFLEQREISDPEQGYITAKFFFVDLAGSERLKKTGATGVTLKEGININLGLLQLGNVISALAIQKKQPQFISYRNSKLTRILQDSLGGNSNTYMIACVSPSESNYQESLNTIKYASKAMNIKNKPVVNRDPHTAHVNHLKHCIHQLTLENSSLKELLRGEGLSFQGLLQGQRDKEDRQHEKAALEMSLLQRKNEVLYLQLKDEKKRRNQLQIQAYDLQREKDILISLVEQFKTNHPEFQIQVDELYSRQNLPLIENYLNKIQQLQGDIFEKDKVISQLQIQYARIHQICEKNDQLLLKKNETIYKLAKQNKQLRKVVDNLKKQVFRANNLEQPAPEDDLSVLSVIDQLCEQQNLQEDQEYHQHADEFLQREQRMQSQIKSVQACISQKEKMLQQMSQDQMELQLQLLLQMREKYHKKIAEIEQERSQLLKQQRSEFNPTAKLAQRIDHLEVELKEYRAKAKQQKHLEGKLQHQSNLIKTLGHEIKAFQMQKIELTRKLKQDKDSFQKFKHKRTQELLAARKDNANKDIQIRKLTNENKKRLISALKNTDQLKKIKQLNETLKQLMKPLRRTRRATQKDLRHDLRPDLRQDLRHDLRPERHEGASSLSKSELQKLVNECLQQLLLRVDRDFDLQKYQRKCLQINSELEMLVKDEATVALKLERLVLADEELEDKRQDLEDKQERQELAAKMRLGLDELRERIANLEDNLQFCQRKHYQILADDNQRYSYDYHVQIVFNPAYDSVFILRDILRAFIEALHKSLLQTYQTKMQKEQTSVANCALAGELAQLRDNIVRMSIEHEETVSQLRNELLLREYENQNEEDNAEVAQRGPSLNVFAGKNESKEKKALEKKVLELTKNISRLNLDIETWRRKCIVIQEKYQSMKALFNKDKFIGRPSREEENVSVGNRKCSFPKPSSHDNIIEELNLMTQQLKSVRVRKPLEEPFDSHELKQTLVVKRRDYDSYKWQCVASIEAHSSPVLCLKTHRDMLISSANRSIRIWHLADNRLLADLQNPSLNTFVRSLALCPHKQLLVAACDKLVTLWDLRQSSNEGVLRGHKEEVRCLHIANNYLFTAGKGLSNSGSLFVWDIRFLSNPLEEKERNQDIFSMTSFKNILYFGSRDHHVRRLNTDTLETLTTFQPPHMDTVTTLAISKNHLISGSKDKNLRLWALDHSIYNLKSTVHASNDYINTVETDLYHPLFYAGDRSGQVKVGTIAKQKIEFLGGFSHTQSVNSICSLEMSKGVATGSTDKTVKLWQPTTETFLQIEDSLY